MHDTVTHAVLKIMIYQTVTGATLAYDQANYLVRQIYCTYIHTCTGKHAHT